MPPIGTHFVQPRAIAARLAAERLLDRRIDKNALDLRVFGRRLDDGVMGRCPDIRVDVLAVGADHHGGRHFFALGRSQFAIGHRREPDVGIEPDLVAGVPGDHRPAARLRHVADQKPRPALLGTLLGQPFEECHQVGVAPVAIARKPHHLPGLAVDRQRNAPGEAALGVEADGARFQGSRSQRRRAVVGHRRDRRGSGASPEQFLRGRFWIVGMGERRQRLWIERAFVLRHSRASRGQQDGKR